VPKFAHHPLFFCYIQISIRFEINYFYQFPIDISPAITYTVPKQSNKLLSRSK